MTIKHDAVTGEFSVVSGINGVEILFRSYSLAECERFKTAQESVRAMEIPDTIPDDLRPMGNRLVQGFLSTPAEVWPLIERIAKAEQQLAEREKIDGESAEIEGVA